MLPVLLGKLGEDHLPCELVFQSLTKMVGLMAEHTRREFSGPVWDALLVCVCVCLSVCECVHCICAYTSILYSEFRKHRVHL